MPSQTHVYEIANDFVHGVNTEKLALEIFDQLSIKPKVLVYGDCVNITFLQALDQNQISQLNSIIALHDASVPTIEGNYAQDNFMSATTSTVYQRKLRLSHSAMDEDDYIVFWNYNYKSSGEEAVDIRVLVDGTEVHRLYEYPEESSNFSHHTGGFAIANFSVGKHTIDIEFRGVGGAATSIWNTRLCIKSTAT